MRKFFVLFIALIFVACELDQTFDINEPYPPEGVLLNDLVGVYDYSEKEPYRLEHRRYETLVREWLVDRIHVYSDKELPEEWLKAFKQAVNIYAKRIDKNHSERWGIQYVYSGVYNDDSNQVNLKYPNVKVIWGITEDVVIARAQLPIKGYPGTKIIMNSELPIEIDYDTKVNAAVHELGHIIGIRHTDSQDGLWIKGTPHEDKNSVFNITAKKWTGFTKWDIRALRILYPHPCDAIKNHEDGRFIEIRDGDYATTTGQRCYLDGQDFFTEGWDWNIDEIPNDDDADYDFRSRHEPDKHRIMLIPDDEYLKRIYIVLYEENNYGGMPPYWRNAIDIAVRVMNKAARNHKLKWHFDLVTDIAMGDSVNWLIENNIPFVDIMAGDLSPILGNQVMMKAMFPYPEYDQNGNPTGKIRCGNTIYFNTTGKHPLDRPILGMEAVTIVIHEFGHIMGIAHTDDYAQGDYVPGTYWADEKSIWNKVLPRNAAWKGFSKGDLKFIKDIYGK